MLASLLRKVDIRFSRHGKTALLSANDAGFIFYGFHLSKERQGYIVELRAYCQNPYMDAGYHGLDIPDLALAHDGVKLLPYSIDDCKDQGFLWSGNQSSDLAEAVSDKLIPWLEANISSSELLEYYMALSKIRKSPRFSVCIERNGFRMVPDSWLCMSLCAAHQGDFQLAGDCLAELGKSASRIDISEMLSDFKMGKFRCDPDFSIP